MPGRQRDITKAPRTITRNNTPPSPFLLQNAGALQMRMINKRDPIILHQSKQQKRGAWQIFLWVHNGWSRRESSATRVIGNWWLIPYHSYSSFFYGTGDCRTAQLLRSMATWFFNTTATACRMQKTPTPIQFHMWKFLGSLQKNYETCKEILLLQNSNIWIPLPKEVSKSKRDNKPGETTPQVYNKGAKWEKSIGTILTSHLRNK